MFQLQSSKTVRYFLFVCPNFSTGCNILKSAVKKLSLNYDLKSILSNKVVYSHLIRFAPPIGYRLILYSLPFCVTKKYVYVIT